MEAAEEAGQKARAPYEEVKSVLEKSEISLVLDTYDDIFSDFDPRPYGERALSVDFLDEAKRAVRFKGEEIELRFLIPKAVRNARHEEVIKQRLRAHFKRHYRLIKAERDAYKKQAVLLVVLGIVIGLVGVGLISLPGLSVSEIAAIGIVLSPASWYTIWTGFDHLLYPKVEKVLDEDFNKKMSMAHIAFIPY